MKRNKRYEIKIKEEINYYDEYANNHLYSRIVEFDKGIYRVIIIICSLILGIILKMSQELPSDILKILTIWNIFIIILIIIDISLYVSHLNKLYLLIKRYINILQETLNSNKSMNDSFKIKKDFQSKIRNIQNNYVDIGKIIYGLFIIDMIIILILIYNSQ